MNKMSETGTKGRLDRTRTVFGVYGYARETEPLQPWLTVREVAAGMLRAGWDVDLVTDLDAGSSLEGMRVHRVRSLRPTNAREMSALLRSLRPDRVIVLSTPLNLSTAGWYPAVDCDLYAFLSYPFYTRAELFRALPHIRHGDMKTYGRHTLVPRSLWGGTLRRYFRGVIGQSARTVNRVAEAAGGNLGRHIIHAGTDTAFWSPAGGTASRVPGPVRFLFVGSPKTIRGFRLLLHAFGRLYDTPAQLRILARGADAAELAEVHGLIDRYCGHNREHITVEGGWLERTDLRNEIRAASVVVLPFVLVPSELPVSVLECVACETPVVTTDIDGLPEAAGPAGLIVPHGSLAELEAALRSLAATPRILAELQRNCQAQRDAMWSWEAMAAAWRELLA